MELLRNEILKEMRDCLTDNQMDELVKVLDLMLYKYDIKPKSTEIAKYDNSNAVILKNFLGCKAIEGCSKNTIKHYSENIQRMLDDIGRNIREITTDDIRHHFALWQVTRGISNATLNNMRKVYCSFFKWLATERIITDNPMLRINPFKTTKKQIKPFTEREMEQLCDGCTTLRDRALVEFLYTTGCRVSECASVNINDINFQQGTVIIRHGKGDKERTCYISNKAMYWIEKYLTNRKDVEECLFIGTRGRLTKNGIEAIIKRLGNRVNIHAHPHKFRHTLATNMVRRNAPIQIVQRILGHEDVSTTMIYVTTDNKEVESFHRKLVA